MLYTGKDVNRSNICLKKNIDTAICYVIWDF